MCRLRANRDDLAAYKYLPNLLVFKPSLSGSLPAPQSKNITDTRSALFLVRAKGIEPSSKAWEAFVLPLYHTRDLANFIQIYLKSPEIKCVIQKISVLTHQGWYATIKLVLSAKEL